MANLVSPWCCWRSAPPHMPTSREQKQSGSCSQPCGSPHRSVGQPAALHVFGGKRPSRKAAWSRCSVQPAFRCRSHWRNGRPSVWSGGCSMPRSEASSWISKGSACQSSAATHVGRSGDGDGGRSTRAGSSSSRTAKSGASSSGVGASSSGACAGPGSGEGSGGSSGGADSSCGRQPRGRGSQRGGGGASAAVQGTSGTCCEGSPPKRVLRSRTTASGSRSP
mmetsp:Transcript_25005/g.75068  ORF Transcript_25005/g.75068 Transcript_25005/m.75068 type:complete len:222 (+) Transcript_25005:264-929(+)